MKIFIRTNTQSYNSPFETKSHAKNVGLTRKRNRTVFDACLITYYLAFDPLENNDDLLSIY